VASEAKVDIANLNAELSHLQGLAKEVANAKASVEDANVKRPMWESSRRQATEAELAIERRPSAVREYTHRAAAREATKRRLTELQQELSQERKIRSLERDSPGRRAGIPEKKKCSREENARTT
jgi:hypothetical protein